MLHVTRPTWKVLIGLCATIVLASDRPAAAQVQCESGRCAGAKSANLQDQLEKGLRARLPSEFAFIERVVNQVNEGQLPESLVRSTFGWARRKRPYPFPYFERGLKQRAARVGIRVQ